MAWRDDISEDAQGDLDTVFSQAAMLAQTLLMRNREFFPFAATINSKGAIGLSTPLPDGAAPTVQDVIESIVAELKKGKAGKRAYAITALARTTEGGEAVRIELEHKEGVALVIGLPVVRNDSGVISFGDMRALPGTRLVWTTKRRNSARAKASPTKTPAKAQAKSSSRTAAKTPTQAKSSSRTATKTPTRAKSSSRTATKTPTRAKSSSRAASKAAPASKAPAKRAAAKGSKGKPTPKSRGTAIATA